MSLRVPGSGPQVSNMLLLKYDSTGAAQWARSVTQASASSSLWAVATDAAGNVHVGGTFNRTGTFGFGNGVTVKGSYYGFQDGRNVGENAALVMYDPGGTAQWALTVSPSASNTNVWGLGIDSSGHIYASYSMQAGTVGFGPGITVSGVGNWYNGVLAKY